MNEIMASRSAGTKLLAILVILLVPMLVLSYLLVETTRKEISFTNNELVGVQLLEATVPLMFDATANKLDAAKLRNIESTVKVKAADLSDQDEAEELIEHVIAAIAAASEENVNQRDTVEKFNELFHAIGNESGLILDPIEETYFLAHTATVALPNVANTYYVTHSMLNNIIADNNISAEEYLGFAKQLGELNWATSVAEDSIVHLKESGDLPEAMAAVDQLFHAINVESIALFDRLQQLQSIDGVAQVKQLAAAASNNESTTQLKPTAWFGTIGELKAQLSQRAKTLNQKLYILLSIAAFCSLAAVGSALSMFKSTLKKLDMVEHARGEAEGMASQLAAMNDDVVVLNQELSINISKLKDAQNDLIKKGRMEQMGQLTATIAHELRNPLGAVRTSTFLLERKIKGKGLDVEKQFERINNGIVRCDNIITQLLDYSRTKELVRKEVDFDQWLVGVIEETVKGLPNSVQIECELGLDDRPIAIDSSRLERAIINLVNNASEALVGKGSDTIESAEHQPKIVVATSLLAGYVHIVVRDNGPGISAENLVRIREPLFTTKSFGTGLGIPAIEQIANQHGGELRIESVEGEGATFILVIPFGANEKAAA